MGMNKNPCFHRRSIRLPGYDYSSEGGYFFTCVTAGREPLFGEVVDREMVLNDFGRIVQEEWFKTAKIRPNIKLDEDEFVVMPNNINGIIWITCWGTARCAPTERFPTERTQKIERFGKPVSNSIPTIIRLFKSTTTKQINQLRQQPGKPVWQRNYYEHIISTEKEYENIANYIFDNPQGWEKDDENQTK